MFKQNSMIAALALLVASCATRLVTGSEQAPSDFTPGIQSRRRVGTGLTLEEEQELKKAKREAIPDSMEGRLEMLKAQFKSMASPEERWVKFQEVGMKRQLGQTDEEFRRQRAAYNRMIADEMENRKLQAEREEEERAEEEEMERKRQAAVRSLLNKRDKSASELAEEEEYRRRREETLRKFRKLTSRWAPEPEPPKPVAPPPKEEKASSSGLRAAPASAALFALTGAARLLFANRPQTTDTPLPPVSLDKSPTVETPPPVIVAEQEILEVPPAPANATETNATTVNATVTSNATAAATASRNGAAGVNAFVASRGGIGATVDKNAFAGMTGVSRTPTLDEIQAMTMNDVTPHDVRASISHPSDIKLHPPIPQEMPPTPPPRIPPSPVSPKGVTGNQAAMAALSTASFAGSSGVSRVPDLSTLPLNMATPPAAAPVAVEKTPEKVETPPAAAPPPPPPQPAKVVITDEAEPVVSSPRSFAGMSGVSREPDLSALPRNIGSPRAPQPQPEPVRTTMAAANVKEVPSVAPPSPPPQPPIAVVQNEDSGVPPSANTFAGMSGVSRTPDIFTSHPNDGSLPVAKPQRQEYSIATTITPENNGQATSSVSPPPQPPDGIVASKAPPVPPSGETLTGLSGVSRMPDLSTVPLSMGALPNRQPQTQLDSGPTMRPPKVENMPVNMPATGSSNDVESSTPTKTQTAPGPDAFHGMSGVSRVPDLQATIASEMPTQATRANGPSQDLFPGMSGVSRTPELPAYAPKAAMPSRSPYPAAAGEAAAGMSGVSRAPDVLPAAFVDKKL